MSFKLDALKGILPSTRFRIGERVLCPNRWRLPGGLERDRPNWSLPLPVGVLCGRRRQNLRGL